MELLLIGLIIGFVIGTVIGQVGLLSYKKYLTIKIDDYSPTDFHVDGKLKFAYLVSEKEYLSMIRLRHGCENQKTPTVAAKS